MEKCDSLVHGNILYMRPLRDEHNGSKACNDPIPVQLSEPEFAAFILPHLSMPKRGPKCNLGYYRVFNLILWVLYTGMQWKCLPVPTRPRWETGHSLYDRVPRLRQMG